MSLDYIVVGQANLHKKKECNVDLALYTDFLLRGHHINAKSQVVLGMKAYNKKFKHRVTKNDNANISRSMQAESLSSESSDSVLTGRSRSSSPESRHSVLLQSRSSSPTAMASYISLPNVPVESSKKPVSKDPLLAERKRFQANIRNYINTSAKGNKGCNGCKTTCNPDVVSRPSSFLVAIQEPHVVNQRISELYR